MRFRLFHLFAFLFSLTMLMPAAQAQAVVKIDGSSTMYPPTEAVAEEFQASTRGKIKVTVGISGTGGGFKKFTRGETDISNASRPIQKAEMEAAKTNGVEYVELPMCFDAITIAVNPKNTWVDHLTVSELKKIWEPDAQGKITKWNQIRPEWPAEDIALFGAGSDSGTFDYFTEAIVGKAKSSRGDYTASEDDNVLVRGIEGSKNALGYLPFAYYVENKAMMKAVPVLWDGHGGKPVLPSMENVQNATYNPLGRPLFIYINKKSVAKPEVKQFVEFYLDNAKELISEVGYLPLPDSAYELCRARFEAMQTGTAFNGEAKVGVHVEEVLKGELHQ